MTRVVAARVNHSHHGVLGDVGVVMLDHVDLWRSISR